MKSLKGRKVKRNAFSKIDKEIVHSKLVVFSDASGEKIIHCMDVLLIYETPKKIILLDGCWLQQCLR